MIDQYERSITYLRMSITERCNLRCRYCMPEEGILLKRHDEMLTEDEMIRAVEAAASIGVTKLRITGGEPLVKKNVLSICKRAAKVNGIRELVMTTNGTLLPRFADSLVQAGVQRINISLDTLDSEKYASITRGGSLKDALQGIESAIRAGFRKVKINSVLIGGFNSGEIRALAELTLKLPVDVRFIELMPMGASFDPSAYVSGQLVLDTLPELIPAEADDGVARQYQLPGAMGNIGIISPVSHSFCASCNRLRLTADGKLKPCLHSRDEFSIKGLDLDGMIAQMRMAIAHKPQQHNGLDAGKMTQSARGMSRIGG